MPCRAVATDGAVGGGWWRAARASTWARARRTRRGRDGKASPDPREAKPNSRASPVHHPPARPVTRRCRSSERTQGVRNGSDEDAPRTLPCAATAASEARRGDASALASSFDRRKKECRVRTTAPLLGIASDSSGQAARDGRPGFPAPPRRAPAGHPPGWPGRPRPPDPTTGTRTSQPPDKATNRLPSPAIGDTTQVNRQPASHSRARLRTCPAAQQIVRARQHIGGRRGQVDHGAG